MAKEIQRRRGTTAEHSTFTGAEGEITVDTTKDTLVVHDGSTAGGFPLAKDTELNNKNVIINGNFDIWQRGTGGFTSGYSADRWELLPGAGATVTASRGTFTLGDIVGEPEFFVSLNRTVAGSGSFTFQQKIEGVRSFAGETVTVSFYVKGSTAFDITTSFVQHFGTGGSPSSDVAVSTQTVSVTTDWTKISQTFSIGSIAGKTLGTGNNDYLRLRWLWPQTEGATSTLDIARVQVELGSVATEFERRSFGQELALTERYFKRYGALGANILLPSVGLSSTGNNTFLYSFPQTMRTSPTSNTNLANGNYTNGVPSGTQWRLISTSGSAITKTGTVTISVVNRSENDGIIRLTGATWSQASDTLQLGSTAFFEYDAEL